MEMNYTHAITLNYNPGSLIRVAVIFERRGHTIDSLQITPALDSGYSQMMLTAKGPVEKQVQIIRQLEKLVDIVAVEAGVEELVEAV